jgi:hypothetical protein
MEPRGGRTSQNLLSPDIMKSYLWGIGVFFLIHFSFILFMRTHTKAEIDANTSWRVISDLLGLVGPLTCAAAGAVATWKLLQVRHQATDLMIRRAWIGVACWSMAGLLNATGQVVWTWQEATNTLQFPGPYDIFYMAVYPFDWIAIAMMMPRNRTLAGRTRVLLDALIVVASILAAVWYFILGPKIASLTGNALERTTALGYPLGDLSLFTASAILLFGQVSNTPLSSTIRRLAIGISILSLTSLLYAYFTLQGTYQTGFWSDVGWPLGWLFIGWALLGYLNDLANMANQPRTYDAGQIRHLGTLSAAIRAIAPALIALLTCGLLIFGVALTSPGLLTQVIVVCAGLFLLPLIRQALTLVDNLILNDRLQAALEHSQQAFQHSQRELLATTMRAEQFEELRGGIEDLRSVHASLAKGDFAVRARVQGPLAPVAQSLNLSLERIGRLSQQVQHNRILEQEAEQIYRALEGLNEGQLASNLPATPSSLTTGRAIFAITRLQNRLSQRFRRTREIVDLLSSRNTQLADLAKRGRTTLPTLAQLQLEQILTQLEKGLKSNTDILKEMQSQTSGFTQNQPQKQTSDDLHSHVKTDTLPPQRAFPFQQQEFPASQSFPWESGKRSDATDSW